MVSFISMITYAFPVVRPSGFTPVVIAPVVIFPVVNLLVVNAPEVNLPEVIFPVVTRVPVVNLFVVNVEVVADPENSYSQQQFTTSCTCPKIEDLSCGLIGSSQR